MTRDEATQFVKDQIRPRYHQMNEVQISDWVCAVQYVLDVPTALQIVRELVQDHTLALTLKSFKRIAWERREKAPVIVVDQVGYDPWVCCIEAPEQHSSWQGRSWMVMEQFRRSDCGMQSYVESFANAAAKRLQKTYGGKWAGECREIDNAPYTGPLTKSEVQEEVIRHILDGPDSAGRRFLLSRRSKKLTLAPTMKCAVYERGAETVEGAAKRIVHAPLTKQEQQAKELVTRLAQPAVRGEPIKADEEFWNNTEDLPPVRDEDVPPDLIEGQE